MIIRLICVSVILVFFVAIQTKAQDSLKFSYISIELGMNSLLNKDEFQSPYVYKGTNFSFKSTYTKVKPKGLHIIDLQYTQGNIQSIVSPSAANRLILLRYAYEFRLTDPKKVFSSFLGGGISSMNGITNYLPSIESSNSYITSISSFTLNGKMTYSLSEKFLLNLDVTLPIIGFIYRPDFDINGKSHSDINNIFEDIWLHLNLEQEFRLNKGFFLKLGYHFNYFTHDKPRRISLMQNGFRLGIKKQL